jgi:hypothetical protein
MDVGFFSLATLWRQFNVFLSAGTVTKAAGPDLDLSAF